VCCLTGYRLITWLLGKLGLGQLGAVPSMVEILYNVPANVGPASLDLLTPRKRHCLLRASRPNKSRPSISIMLNLDKKLGLPRGLPSLDSPITRPLPLVTVKRPSKAMRSSPMQPLQRSLLGAGASRQLTNCPQRTLSAGWGCKIRTNLTEDVSVE